MIRRPATTPVLRRVMLFPGLLAMLTALTIGHGEAYAKGLRDCDPLSYQQVRDGTIAPLMTAIQNGDVRGIGEHLSEAMKQRYRTLLERNETYPDYLRDRYGDSSYLLRDVTASDIGYTAVIEIYWPNGDREVFDFDLGARNPYLPPPEQLPGCSEQTQP